MRHTQNPVLVVATVLSGLLILAAHPPALAGEEITVSKETTFVTGPLTKDGYVDFRAALNERLSQGVTPENNAVALLMQAFGPRGLPDQFFKELGIKQPPAEGDYFTELFEHPTVKAKLASLPGDPTQFRDDLFKSWTRAMEAPWRESDFPMIAQWLRGNEKPLAVAVRASKRTRYFYPAVKVGDKPLMFQNLLPGIQAQRELSRKLVARAMLRIGSNDLEGAWNDLLAVHRLARLLAKGPTLIESLVGIALDGIAWQGDQVLSRHPKLTSEQALRMKRELAKLPRVSRVSSCVDFAERLIYLDYVQHVSREPGRDFDKLRDLFERVMRDKEAARSCALLARIAKPDSLRWNEVMRNGNRWFDRYLAAGKKATFKERDNQLAKLDMELEKAYEDWCKLHKTAKSFPMGIKEPDEWLADQLGNGLVGLLAPAQQACMRVEARNHCRFYATQIAFSLSAYHHDHDSYPTKLNKLVPKYLEAVPQNPFGEELTYSSDGTTYSLTFVGPDEHYDVVLTNATSEPPK